MVQPIRFLSSINITTRICVRFSFLIRISSKSSRNQFHCIGRRPERPSTPTAALCALVYRPKEVAAPVGARIRLKTVLRATTESAKLLLNSSRMSLYIHHGKSRIYSTENQEDRRTGNIRKMRFSRPQLLRRVHTRRTKLIRSIRNGKSDTAADFLAVLFAQQVRAPTKAWRILWNPTVRSLHRPPGSALEWV